jgi:dienelactone hydrolase
MKTLFLVSAVAMVFASCSGSATNDDASHSDTAAAMSRVKTENVSFDLGGGTTSQSVVTFDEAASDKRPVVLILPEWWGLTEYPKNRAKQFAEMGYFAMAVDLYGNGKVAETPDSAGALAGAFYSDPQMAKSRIDAALAKARTYAQADPSKVILVGYCFGGGLALNAAKLGGDYTAVCSFHGSLKGVPPQKGTTKARIFVAHGAADANVPAEDVAQFKKGLDSTGTPYTFKEYADATHAFTNPAATETGKRLSMPIAYNAAADSASWADMKAFLAEVF